MNGWKALDMSERRLGCSFALVCLLPALLYLLRIPLGLFGNFVLDEVLLTSFGLVLGYNFVAAVPLLLCTLASVVLLSVLMSWSAGEKIKVSIAKLASWLAAWVGLGAVLGMFFASLLTYSASLPFLGEPVFIRYSITPRVFLDFPAYGSFAAFVLGLIASSVQIWGGVEGVLRRRVGMPIVSYIFICVYVYIGLGSRNLFNSVFSGRGFDCKISRKDLEGRVREVIDGPGLLSDFLEKIFRSCGENYILSDGCLLILLGLAFLFVAGVLSVMDYVKRDAR
ncbi:hypothetical protein ACUH90_02385 [Dermabacteraceae bacterium P7054]